MGSSGGNSGRYSASHIQEKIRETRDKTKDKAFETTIEKEINEMLGDFNYKDDRAIQEHLDEIKSIINDEIEGSIDLKFGGSVKKYTYINGLSDIDTLVIINKTDLENSSPSEVLNYLCSRLKDNLGGFKTIKTGTLAVTIDFDDGTNVQILPAIKVGEGFKIPASSGKKWSNIIRPDKFANRLTKINQSLSNNVIPTIKLVKSIIAQLPKDQQLKGYHIESLAIESFKNYPNSKSKTKKALMKHFFEKANEIVKSPIKDKTGQSIHVDDYLGKTNSNERIKISNTLKRIYNQMERADSIRSKDSWSKILEE